MAGALSATILEKSAIDCGQTHLHSSSLRRQEAGAGGLQSSDSLQTLPSTPLILAAQFAFLQAKEDSIDEVI